MNQNTIHLGSKFNAVVDPKRIDSNKVGLGWPILYITAAIILTVIIYFTYRMCSDIIRKRRLLKHLKTEPTSQRYDFFRTVLSKKIGLNCYRLPPIAFLEHLDPTLKFTQQDLDLMVSLKYSSEDSQVRDIEALDQKLINLIKRS
ncbi:MAG: hypothetical protein KAG98_07090 [Lentisphaeria bacterium]|nr:hypothetical protein [Lentisphaeria bacterium]